MSVGARSGEGKGMHSPGWGERVDHVFLSHPGTAPPKDEGCKTSSRKSLALQIMETKSMNFSPTTCFILVLKSSPYPNIANCGASSFPAMDPT